MFTNDGVVEGAVEQKRDRELQSGFVDIAGLNKGQVLFALYSYANTTSALFKISGFSQTFGASEELTDTDNFVALRMAIDPVKISAWGEKGVAFKEFQEMQVAILERAKNRAKGDTLVDHVDLGAGPKTLKVNFFKDATFRAFAYDREYGAGRAQLAINTLKEVVAAIASDRERDQRIEAEVARAAQGLSVVRFDTTDVPGSSSLSSSSSSLGRSSSSAGSYR
jgi:hypothetical protein